MRILLQLLESPLARGEAKASRVRGGAASALGAADSARELLSKSCAVLWEKRLLAFSFSPFSLHLTFCPESVLIFSVEG